MKITTLGIDLAKSVFHLIGCDEKGKEVFRKMVRRHELKKVLLGLFPCQIGMEACGSASYWTREFQKMGHEVKLILPQYVKPFVKTNKNDFNDAHAICEAMARPNRTFAAIKTEEDQDLQSLHRIRQQVVQIWTSIINQIRGLLAEYGIVLGPSPKKVCQALAQHLAPETSLSPWAKSNFGTLLKQLGKTEAHLGACNQTLESIAKCHPVCQMLLKVPGIGVLTATALLSSIGNPNRFKNGRQFAASLGLVPDSTRVEGKAPSWGFRSVEIPISGRSSFMEDDRSSCGPEPRMTPEVDGWWLVPHAGERISPVSPWPTRMHGFSGPC